MIAQPLGYTPRQKGSLAQTAAFVLLVQKKPNALKMSMMRLVLRECLRKNTTKSHMRSQCQVFIADVWQDELNDAVQPQENDAVQPQEKGAATYTRYNAT